MKNHVRLLSLLLVLILLLVACAPAGDGGAATTTPPPAATTDTATPAAPGEQADAGHDISEFVNLRIMLVSSATTPDYHNVMLPVLNEKLRERINAELEVEFIGWGEFAQRIPLVLASGEAFDGINASTWTRFYELAAEGAYYDITDLAPIYLPRTYAEWCDNMRAQITINGRIYGLPTFHVANNVMSYIIRGDIADEVGFEGPIRNLLDFGEFMRLVARYRPDMWTGDWTATSDNLLAQFARDNGFLLWPAAPMVAMDAREGVPTVIYKIDGALDFFHLMKEWSDEGLWSRGVLADTSTGNFNEGRAASRLHHQGTWRDTYVNFPEWQPRVYRTVPYTLRTRAMQDGFAIPQSSRHPERALMMYDIFFQEREFWELLAYGVRGIHWDLNPDGTLNMLVPGETWSPGAYNDWAFQRNEWIIPLAAWPANLDEINADLRAAEIHNPFALFNVDFTTIANERAALADVHTQFALPLTYGFVDDVDAAYQELLDMAYAAGLQVLMDEINRQLAEFVAAHGITLP